jgi:hypothetical protein
LAERGPIPIGPTTYISANYTYYGLLKRSTESPGDPQLAAMLVLSGMEQVDALCDEWFRQLALAQAELRATDDLATAGGTLTAGLMALANAGTAATGAVALTTGFAHALLTTAQANFIVAPDVAVVAQTNRSLRAAEHTCVSTYARAGALDNFRARKFVVEYAQMCTPVAVKELINQSIAAKAVAATATQTSFCTSAQTVGGTNILAGVTQPPPLVIQDGTLPPVVSSPAPLPLSPPVSPELSLNLGDGLKDQAAAWG